MALWSRRKWILSEKLNPAYITNVESLYEQQWNQRQGHILKNPESFGNIYRESVTGKVVDVSASVALSSPSAGQRIGLTMETLS